ncbi:transcription termination factor, mitochondrial-like isoform X2 [Achroia grisella]|uniref:transcription termination factor, mitochondrial-like isoform X2 n=1 Tax=Achroia grisella TaxID=688607 RepID=UPI0027D2F2BE|nr:transcription termination factor, mitochondrial-like isoform X2 [Achroia grisella]
MIYRHLIMNVIKSFTPNSILISKKTLLIPVPCFCNINILYSSSKIRVSQKRKESIRNGDNGLHIKKEKIISLLNFQTKDDASPFYKLPIKTLLHVYKTTKIDDANLYCKNRLYYISSQLNYPSSLLSTQLARRTFIYSLSFSWLKNSLEVLLDMGVETDRIVRDLWVLKYHSETIRERLQNVKDRGIDVLYPWMVRCSEDILNRYVHMSLETKNILGETKTTQIYLANRLNISSRDVDTMCRTIPALKTIRVKYFLDFLEEEGFQLEDIASKPRILSASPKTVKKRLLQLRNLGIRQINLNILCRSKKNYKKYYESIASITKKNEQE